MTFFVFSSYLDPIPPPRSAADADVRQAAGEPAADNRIHDDGDVDRHKHHDSARPRRQHHSSLRKGHHSCRPPTAFGIHRPGASMLVASSRHAACVSGLYIPCRAGRRVRRHSNTSACWGGGSWSPAQVAAVSPPPSLSLTPPPVLVPIGTLCFPVVYAAIGRHGLVGVAAMPTSCCQTRSPTGRSLASTSRSPGS